MTIAIPTISIGAMFVTLGLCFLFPAVLWIVLGRGHKGFSRAALAGMLGFLVPQLLIRIPLLQLLGAQGWFQQFAASHFYLYLLALAFTAGLFETAGRFLVFRFLVQKPITYRAGLGAGLGHGGFEAVALVGITYINNIVLSFLINSGSVPLTGQYQVLAAQLSAVSPSLFLAAGYERVCTILLHMALSVLVAMFWMRGQKALGFLLCTGVHTLVDFVIPLVNYLGSTGLTMVLLGVTGALSVGYMVLCARKQRPRNIFT